VWQWPDVVVMQGAYDPVSGDLHLLRWGEKHLMVLQVFDLIAR
jgi:hypothetical protein